jgi:hypothetical protein
MANTHIARTQVEAHGERKFLDLIMDYLLYRVSLFDSEKRLGPSVPPPFDCGLGGNRSMCVITRSFAVGPCAMFFGTATSLAIAVPQILQRMSLV